MTLRRALGADVRRVHELVDRLLDSRDGLIVLFDGERTVSFGEGFGLSPCHLELLALEIERTIRTATGEAGVDADSSLRTMAASTCTGDQACGSAESERDGRCAVSRPS